MTHSFPTRRSSDLLIDRPSAVGGADRLGCGRQREASKRKRKQGTYHRARSFLMRSPNDWRSSSSSAASTVAPNGCASAARSEEHTSELQSLMRNSYALF